MSYVGHGRLFLFYHIIWFYYYFIYFFFSPPIHSPNDLSYVGHGFLFYLNFFILFYPHPSVLFFPIYSPNCLFHVGQGWLFNLIFFLSFDLIDWFPSLCSPNHLSHVRWHGCWCLSHTLVPKAGKCLGWMVILLFLIWLIGIQCIPKSCTRRPETYFKIFVDFTSENMEN